MYHTVAHLSSTPSFPKSSNWLNKNALSVSILVAAIGVGVAAYALYYIVDIINRKHEMWPELICKTRVVT